MFAYDFSDDTIWGCDARPNNQPPPAPLLPIDPLGSGDPFTGIPAHLTLDGTQIPSCDSTAFDQQATWVVGAPGQLYVQSEDDQTLFQVDSRTCAILRTMHHRNFGEPIAEDEQMACDSLSFGREAVDAGMSPLTKPTSVIWLRDANAGKIVAYALPQTSCPYPTETTVVPGPAVARGAVANLCALLSHRGVPAPVGREPLDFTLDGRYVGRGYTDRAGLACVATFVNLAAGTYPVTASFAGNDEYSPSHGAGTQNVNVPAILGNNPPLLPPPVVSNGGPPPPPQQVNLQPGSNSNPATEPQTQVQSQQQAQGQSQAQANLQPGMVAQEQEQVQVQLAPAALPEEQQMGYAMSAANQDHTAQAMGLAGGAAFAAFVAAGVAWALRSPAAVLTRTRSRARRRRWDRD